MMRSLNRLLCLCATVTLLCWNAPSVAQAYKLHGQSYTSSWPAHNWRGEVQFPSVFCMRMPRPEEALNMTQSMFNGGAILLTRVIYPDNISLYVVNSTIPGGRTVEDEMGRLRAANLQSAHAYPDNISISDINTLFGPTNTLTIKNVLESTLQGPFPLTRGLVKRDDGMLMSLSVHRLFARGPDRFEVAGLKYFIPVVTAADQERTLAELTTFVEQAVDSLQRCTSTMPVRVGSKPTEQQR